MGDEQLKALTARIGRALRPWEATLAALVTLLVLLAPWPVEDTPIWQASEVEILTQSAGSSEGSIWQSEQFWRVDPGEGVVRVRWAAPDDAFQTGVPMALALSGPFSAHAFLNGQPLGAKGQPVGADRPEQAGPIDSLIALPPELVQPSGNIIELEVSSTRAGYDPAVVLQTVGITPYRPDARRSLRLYAPTLGLAGGLAVLAVGLVRLAQDRSDRRLYWLAAGLGALVVAALAEMSRAYVNYPYSWHQPRQAVILVGMTLFCLGLLGFLVQRWPIARVWLWSVSTAGGLGALAGVLLYEGYDGKIILATMMLLGAGLVWCLLVGWRQDRNGWALGGLIAALLAVNFVAPGWFIDLGVYALTAVGFGVWMVRAPDLLSPAAESPTPDLAVQQAALTVQSTGRLHRVALEDIEYLKAAGNYTEVHRSGGDWLLDQRGLAAVLEEAGPGLLRIHRSYAVNLAKVDALLTRPGSRYALSLTGGAEAPVGRSRVDAVRDALAR